MPNIDIAALRALEQGKPNLLKAAAICEAFPGLLDEVERLRVENDETNRLLHSIAAEMAQTDRMHCLACSNHMKNMRGDHQGCDGNCRHDYGDPKTAEEVLMWFRGDCLEAAP